MSTLLAMSGANDAWPATLVKGAAAFTSTKQTFGGANPDDRTWTVPAGVWSIHVVLFGGGGYPIPWNNDSPVFRGFGGAGGGCRWRNRIPVQPGEVLTIKMHTGVEQANITPRSYRDIGLYRANGALLLWAGGGSDWLPGSIRMGGAGTPIGGHVGGGNGGDTPFAAAVVASGDQYVRSGGGGAGGLTGNGATPGYRHPTDGTTVAAGATTGDGRPVGSYTESSADGRPLGNPHGGGWSLSTSGTPTKLNIAAVASTANGDNAGIGAGASGAGVWYPQGGSTTTFYGGRSACGIMWGDTRSFPSNLT